MRSGYPCVAMNTIMNGADARQSTASINTDVSERLAESWANFRSLQNCIHTEDYWDSHFCEIRELLVLGGESGDDSWAFLLEQLVTNAPPMPKPQPLSTFTSSSLPAAA